MQRRTTLWLLLVSTLSSTATLAQAPDSLSVQGILTDTLGNPIDSTGVSATFKLYKGSTEIWSETQSIDVNDGVFNVYLGVSTPMDTVAFSESIDLGITLVGSGVEMSPRTPLVSGAWARALPGLYTHFRAITTTRSYNVIGGADNNSVSAGATGATIGGGGGVTGVGQDDLSNSVTGNFGTVGGGATNTAAGESTVAGGWENSASNGGSVGGGRGNEATGSRASVAGGLNNLAEGSRSSVAGGQNNTATGDRATVAGGYLNDATGQYSTVGGGDNNDATGQNATVPGGAQNLANGNYSVAMGRRAQADHVGSFVWQDSSTTGWLQSTTDNQFLARASGGFKFLTAAGPDTTVGAGLASGSGAWADLSSVDAKTVIRPVDGHDYLERVASLAITEWSYKTESPSITHVGPMAEDFHAAFGHGPNNRSITTVDASGVALAAIQGLYLLLREQQIEIDRLRNLVED